MIQSISYTLMEKYNKIELRILKIFIYFLISFNIKFKKMSVLTKTIL